MSLGERKPAANGMRSPFGVILMHQPGPTPGSIWVCIPEKKILFVGDAVSPQTPPFFAYANLDFWLESVQLLLNSYQDFVLISGRGGILTKPDLTSQRNYLKKVLKGMDGLFERGAAPDEVEELVPGLLKGFDVEH